MPPKDQAFLKYINALVLILFSFSFSENLFPLYSGLKEKNNKNCVSIINTTSAFSTLAYVSISIFALILFGKGVLIDANIMLNIQAEDGKGSLIWDSVVLQVLFLIIQICNVPTGFFPGKEAMLIIIDEINNSSISKSLKERMREIKLEELEERKVPEAKIGEHGSDQLVADKKITSVVTYETHETELEFKQDHNTDSQMLS